MWRHPNDHTKWSLTSLETSRWKLKSFPLLLHNQNMSMTSYHFLLPHAVCIIYFSWQPHPRLIYLITFITPGLILGLRPANERRRYFVTTSRIGWAQDYNQPCYTVSYINVILAWLGIAFTYCFTNCSNVLKLAWNISVCFFVFGDIWGTRPLWLHHFYWCIISGYVSSLFQHVLVGVTVWGRVAIFVREVFCSYIVDVFVIVTYVVCQWDELVSLCHDARWKNCMETGLYLKNVC